MLSLLSLTMMINDLESILSIVMQISLIPEQNFKKVSKHEWGTELQFCDSTV